VSRRLLPIAAVLVVALSATLIAAGAAFAQGNPVNERCYACHDKPGLASIDANGVRRSLTVGAGVYDHSMHSLLDCTSCHIGFKASTHTAAETAGWFEQASLIACGHCHGAEAKMYSGSFHGTLVLKSGEIGTAPTCGACHGSHGIINVASQAFRTQVTERCQSCHRSRSKTYLDTYHGKAFELGRDNSATCPDCHGGHQILPQSDARSSISSRRIVATCAKCHPGANKSFASYLVHVNPGSPTSSALVFGVNAFYIILIAVVFTFGGVHSVLYFWRGRRQGLYPQGGP
jgi:hypothetical protein